MIHYYLFQMIFLQHIGCGTISGIITVNVQRKSRLWFRQALFTGIFLIEFLCFYFHGIAKKCCTWSMHYGIWKSLIITLCLERGVRKNLLEDFIHNITETLVSTWCIIKNIQTLGELLWKHRYLHDGLMHLRIKP